MSESVKYSPLMADEGELVDNIESRVQIVSTSSSSQSSHNLQPVNTVSVNEIVADHGIVVSKSCDDLISDQGESKEPISRSQSCLGLSGGKYDYVQSKIKQYIDVLNPGQIEPPKQIVPKATKEEYLEEINNRLMRELEEKNVTLLQLQENYEHLLLKYAEAQNKIDNLRFQSSSNAGETSGRNKYKPKLVIKNIGKPAVYQYKNQSNSFLRSPKEEPSEKDVRIDRPSTLAVDNLMRTNEKEGLKAVTPTDSEGVSSVVTSMSGHSKIITNLDDADQNKKAPTLKSDILEKTLPANDPYDKVKNWQSSLPPLDMIETPDTGLYDLEPEPITTLSTRYNELPVSDLENIPETPEWATHTKTATQIGMKKYLRTLSLPSSLTRRNILSQIYKRRNIHTIDVGSLADRGSVFVETEVQPPETDATQCTVIRRKKRPPFLRSSSLPVYDYETPRSVLRCHVPPLDLDNLTLSEDETSPISKSNALTSPSFLTNHDCSFQTLNSLNSCKATISDYSLSRQNVPGLHKSTSITPDRSKEMFFFEESREYLTNCCNVCGEMLVPGKAASFHGIHLKDSSDARFPICRSMSFNTETTSPTRLSSLTSQDPSESFDAYTNNLKARSQITLKALTAHVNNA